MSLEPWMRSRPTSRTRKSPHKKENSVQHAQNSATRATARRTTLHRSEEGRSTGVSLGQKQTDTISNLRGSQHIPLVYLFTQVHAWNTNFLNTDRMGKRDGPTAVHMKPFSTSVFNNSDRDVSSSFRATQFLTRELMHPTMWNTSVFEDRLTHVQ